MKKIDQFYHIQPEPIKDCLVQLRDMILGMDENITTTWKYKMPFFSYKEKMFCYLWKDKESGEPYIGFIEGKRVDNPILEQGNSLRMMLLRVNPYQDINEEMVKSVLDEILDLYREGVVGPKVQTA